MASRPFASMMVSFDESSSDHSPRRKYDFQVTDYLLTTYFILVNDWLVTFYLG